MCVCAHLCMFIYLCPCGYDCICVCVCMCDLSNTHPLFERHITLQMTLLDGVGPFKYSTLMQSAVNTLNQAAEEEAAYTSSASFSISLSLSCSYSPFISFFVSLILLPICFKSVSLHSLFLLSTFWFPSLC